MGIIHVTAQLRNISGKGKRYEADFLVDTGAVDCMAPGDELRKLGIKPERKVTDEWANGKPVKYEVGFARVSFLGSETIAPVIFGPPNVEPILGVIALEATGISVDPRTQQLKRMPALPLKIAAKK